ncbi:MAG: divalent-cation tolerance protein CutA [Firmicutes bacterium]|jgi:periplasmic divalent cation tolerance protein|nr:divalent-cation tolerance protein CutA [Bacillota bacterium]
MALLAIVTTTDSKEAARAIARALVEKGLAACVQISAIESFYRWQGTVQQDQEYRIVAKTTEERYQEVEKAIRDMHSYELPAIYGVPLDPVYGPYADWVKDNSQGAHES